MELIEDSTNIYGGDNDTRFPRSTTESNDHRRPEERPDIRILIAVIDGLVPRLTWWA